MPIKRQTYRLDQIDDWQGPVQQSGPTRDAAAQRVRDRLAGMSPTERVLSELTERPPTPRAAFPLRENAQTSRPMPPMAGQMFLDAGLGALEAFDQPPTGMRAGVPYTTPLRLLSASGAVPSALAARAYDASGRGSVMADAPVVDPLQPADKQSMFSTAIAQRGGGKGAQALGFVADLLTPDVTDAFTGGLLPLAALASSLKKVKGAEALRVFRGSPELEKFPKLRDFGAVFSATDEATAGQYGKHVSRYDIKDPSTLLDTSTPQAKSLVEEFSGEKFSDVDYEDAAFPAHYMFPTKRFAAFLEGKGFTGIRTGRDVGVFNPASLVTPTERKLTNGLYSRLDEAAQMVPAKGVPATAVMNWLKKAPEGISLEEASWRKLPEWLASQGTKTVTPEMLAAHLKANPAPFPTVKTLGGAGNTDPQLLSGYRIKRLSGADADALGATAGDWQIVDARGGDVGPPISGRFNEREAVAAFASDAEDSGMAYVLGVQKGPTKFSQYQVDGGENYRETLLTLPSKGLPFDEWAKQYRDFDPSVTPEQLQKAYAKYQAGDSGITVRNPAEFRSSHYPDDPNLLVHTRSNDRTLPSGERIRYGEEAQSDLFQLAKKEGYRDSAKVAAMEQAEKELAVARTRQRDEFEKLKEMSDRLGNPNADNAPPELMQQLSAWKEASKITDQAATVYRDAGRQTGGTIPDTVAPLEGAWADLGLKQMYIEAANDPTLDGIGFTGAKRQIERWGTERLAWEPTGQGGFKVSFEPQVGGNAAGGDMGEEALRRGLIQNSNKTVFSLDELTELLGGSEVKAEKAWKRMNAQPEGGIYQPRAEGMTHFYDETGGELRNRAAKIVKPFGGTVEQGAVSTNPRIFEKKNGWFAETPAGQDGPFPTRELAAEHWQGSSPSWISRLTPEMKDAIKRGVPLMSIVAAALSAGLISTADAQQIKQQGYR